MVKKLVLMLDPDCRFIYNEKYVTSEQVDPTSVALAIDTQPGFLQRARAAEHSGIYSQSG